MARTGKLALAAGIMLTLAGCEEGAEPLAFLKNDKPAETAAAPAAAPGPKAATTTRIVERDVEAPQVFQKTDDALWDGRPSLGGVWIAHPDVKDPERVIIRNPANGKFVIGALFRRERENPGPRMQLSSDAAAALGMIAGAPGKLNVTALRRQEAPEPAATPVPATAVAAAAPAGKPAAPGKPGAIEQKPLDPVTPRAQAAIAAAAANGAKPAAGQKPATAPAPAAKPGAPAAPVAATPPAAAAQAAAQQTAGKSYIQIGIFSVEANAKATADKLQKAGVTASVKQEQSQGKTFWRVMAGPAASPADRGALLGKVKGLGFTDAYFVSR